MYKRISLLVSALVLTLGARQAHAQNLLQDGSFDAATPGSQTSNSAWSLTVDFLTDAAYASAQFQSGSYTSTDAAAPRHGVWFKSYLGDPVNTANATLTQWLAVAAGGDYRLTFDAKREANFAAAVWGVSLGSSGSGGSDWIDLLAFAPADGSWNSFSLLLSGVAPGDILTVTAQMTDGVLSPMNPQSAFVDNFELVAQSVPEPGALGLLAVGLIAVLGRHRRRERQR